LADSIHKLFDDYAVCYARGEQPDPIPYLDQAGEQASELAWMLDAFLQWAPPPAPDETAVILMQAWLAGEPPLRELRVHRGVRVEEIVVALVQRFDIDVGLRGKLRRYFQRLERGSLDLERVDQPVVDAIAEILRTSRGVLFSWASAPRRDQASAVPAYRADREPTVAPAIKVADEDVWDRVDQLFLGPSNV
jgi:hypothetical protein